MNQYAVIDATTGELMEEFPQTTDTELTEAITLAGERHRVFRFDTTHAERARLIGRVGELHLERAEELANIISIEMGKPLRQALGEVTFAASIYEYYAEHGPGMLADEPIDNPGRGRTFVRRTSLGVILGIMPWNFPYYQVARFAAPNLVAGNTVLLKHAEQCPRSAEAIARIFRDAGFAEGAYVNIRPAHSQMERIIADPFVQGVSLTGSERAGAAVAEIAGRHLKKVLLELGGSDVFLVIDTDDIDAAVKMAVRARTTNSGQACNASKRIVVADKHYDEFAEKFTAAMGTLRVGTPHDDADLGPLSSQRAAELLSGQVSSAVDAGATLHVGAATSDGSFFPPTVLSGVTPEMDAYREELFGPVAVLYRVQNDDEAIRLANSSPYGLGSVVICDDPVRAEAIGDRLDVGMVYLNGPAIGGAHLPFGGVKRSGFGRELGRFGIDEFVNKKLFVHAS